MRFQPLSTEAQSVSKKIVDAHTRFIRHLDRVCLKKRTKRVFAMNYLKEI